MLYSNAYTLFAAMLGLLGTIVFSSSPATTWAHQGLPLLFGKGEHSEGLRSGVVGEIDLYLIALVLYIFGFGIYELFISEIEELKRSKQSPGSARLANSRISRAKLSSSLRSAAFGSFCVKISPRRLRSPILRSRFRFMRNGKRRGLLRAYILGSLLKFHFKFYRRVTRE